MAAPPFAPGAGKNAALIKSTVASERLGSLAGSTLVEGVEETRRPCEELRATLGTEV